jgi:hypothetical protein
MSLNNQIDKAQEEANDIQKQGLKGYLWTRKVKMPLAVFLIVIAASFLVGAILL